MPARTAHLLRPASSDHGAGIRDLRNGPFYSKSVTVIIHSVTPPTHTGSRTRGCLLGQRHVSRASDCPTHVRHQGRSCHGARHVSHPSPSSASASRCGGVRELDVRPPAQVCHWSRVMLLRAQLSRTMSAGPTYVRVVRFGGRTPGPPGRPCVTWIVRADQSTH